MSISVRIDKGENGLVGITIGGGPPLCPVVYIVQVFDNTPAQKSGQLEPGDELLSVNGKPVTGMTKTQIAKKIKSMGSPVHLEIRKLQTDPKEYKSLDIALKNIKHRVVESMSQQTADTLGLSRAILVNDDMIQKLQHLEKNTKAYQELAKRIHGALVVYKEQATLNREIGDIFAELAVHEVQPNASKAFTLVGESHRQFSKTGLEFVQEAKPLLSDMHTFLTKAIPDTRLTVKKYANIKFEYLSYCLKAKEMDDEEATYYAMHEPLYRVYTGNMEYRLTLRCRHIARTQFAALRKSVSEKLQLLENKRIQDISFQLERFISAMEHCSQRCLIYHKGLDVFPIELDLDRGVFKSAAQRMAAALYDTDSGHDDDAGCSSSAASHYMPGGVSESGSSLAGGSSLSNAGREFVERTDSGRGEDLPRRAGDADSVLLQLE
ncbi:PRKCA-binding protein-like [Sycon ciliatum]|uniref:PRKCA-binding protein-like n=1 Tax=Sycon ciliatum TaxID=27933 RepID=UPI0020AA2D8B|eukprot:scpid76027/ scgid21744/ PRKCA-binding protein; Protein interacting with C kinase 1; Protein kinase C-alpha-binding protein